MRACTYSRVSTEEQARGLSLAAQRHAGLDEIARRGWEVADNAFDTASGKSLRRPGLQRLLTRLADGELDALVVSKMDRLSRSTLDFYDLLGRAEKEGWTLICLQPNVDMTDPMGRAMAGMAAIFAQFEREMISQRQTESIVARRAAGTFHFSVDPQVYDRMRDLRKREGLSVEKIARRLEIEGWLPPSHRQRGNTTWDKSTVWRMMKSVEILEPTRRRKAKPKPLVVSHDDADHGHENEQDRAEDVAQVSQVSSRAEAYQSKQDEQDTEVSGGDVGHVPAPTLAARRALSAHRAIGR